VVIDGHVDGFGLRLAVIESLCCVQSESQISPLVWPRGGQFVTGAETAGRRGKQMRHRDENDRRRDQLEQDDQPEAVNQCGTAAKTAKGCYKKRQHGSGHCIA
jgi:hypothetical protein